MQFKDGIKLKTCLILQKQLEDAEEIKGQFDEISGNLGMKIRMFSGPKK